jgi:hypothetical protein
MARCKAKKTILFGFLMLGHKALSIVFELSFQTQHCHSEYRNCHSDRSGGISEIPRTEILRLRFTSLRMTFIPLPPEDGQAG